MTLEEAKKLVRGMSIRALAAERPLLADGLAAAANYELAKVPEDMLPGLLEQLELELQVELDYGDGLKLMKQELTTAWYEQYEKVMALRTQGKLMSPELSTLGGLCLRLNIPVPKTIYQRLGFLRLEIQEQAEEILRDVQEKWELAKASGEVVDYLLCLDLLSAAFHYLETHIRYQRSPGFDEILNKIREEIRQNPVWLKGKILHISRAWAMALRGETIKDFWYDLYLIGHMPYPG